MRRLTAPGAAPLRGLAAALLWGLAAAGAAGHELEAQRLTLVLRDARHVQLSFQLRPGELLHRMLAPGRPWPEFVLAHAAMAPPDFAKALRSAQARFEAGTRIAGPGGRTLPVTGWRWPEPAKVQGQLQRLAMQAVVAPADHAAEDALEVRAELTAAIDLDALQLLLPAEARPVLVVSYRPRQAWLQKDSGPLAVKF